MGQRNPARRYGVHYIMMAVLARRVPTCNYNWSWLQHKTVDTRAATGCTDDRSTKKRCAAELSAYCPAIRTTVVIGHVQRVDMGWSTWISEMKFGS
jgi:hypothetical protein